ncbi:hypothetical protein FRC11_004911 [Ceratobasidium sp. 423]|nr:hypothetical protein FRC11_004911 [Ceratobasidium sp. 423]
MPYPELQGSMRALVLQSYSHFRGPIQYLTGNARYKVSRWALDTEQWSITEQLGLVLEVFKEPTDWMSWSGVPLVSEVIPELLTVRDRLYDVRDDTFQQNLHPTVRVAAEASLLVFEKYMGLMLEESDVHVIAIVMCPDRKLKWYTDRGYKVDSIRSRVVSRFEELYPNTTQEAQSQNNPQPIRNIFLQRHSSLSTAPTPVNADTIKAYLDSPVITHDVLTQHGGVIPYWNNELSVVPSLLAWHSIILRRLTWNAPSRAQMAIGSWFGTPLLPDVNRAAAILGTRM